MSKLSIDQKTIKDLLMDDKSDFIIPDYQRPYAWADDECQTLWDDLVTFAIPNDNPDSFNDEEEYFLGPIVTFKNGKQLEVIDGQQRLTTIMLLLRAFYDKFEKSKSANSIKMYDDISKCIWKTDEYGNKQEDKLKIDSKVATDDDKEDFLRILKTGLIDPKHQSKYSKNFQFFKKKIDELINNSPDFCNPLVARILKKCILLPIEAESQDIALRIFSTLNDRGKPLSDADIFKAQLYKYYTQLGKKDQFIDEWKELDEICCKIFKPIYGTPMDELFTKYMYFVRAKLGIKSSTTEALRKFYEKDSYCILKNEDTFNNLINLAEFWKAIDIQDKERFSERVLKKLFVLNYAPNGMWAYFVSVYYMANKDEESKLDDEKFYNFLDKIILYIFAYSITNPGVNALRTPVYSEMINIVNGKDVTFEDFKFESAEKVKSILNNYSFNNNRTITKSMLTWWAFENENQQYVSLDIPFEIEHIYAKKRLEVENGLTNKNNIESLGNKSILEKKINIRAADYRFCDKAKYYQGYKNEKGQIKEGSCVMELIELTKKNEDFTEIRIKERNELIINSFVDRLIEHNLI